MIQAEIFSANDDGGPSVQFDATGWFQQAADEAITRLRGEGYGFGYASDEVAEYTAGQNKLLRQFFQYVDFRFTHGRGGGFYVCVSQADAESWIAEHRPHIAAETIMLLTPKNR